MELDWIASLQENEWERYDVQIEVTKTAQSNQRATEKSIHCAYKSSHTNAHMEKKNR